MQHPFGHTWQMVLSSPPKRSQCVNTVFNFSPSARQRYRCFHAHSDDRICATSHCCHNRFPKKWNLWVRVDNFPDPHFLWHIMKSPFSVPNVRGIHWATEFILNMRRWDLQGEVEYSRYRHGFETIKCVLTTQIQTTNASKFVCTEELLDLDQFFNLTLSRDPHWISDAAHNCVEISTRRAALNMKTPSLNTPDFVYSNQKSFVARGQAPKTNLNTISSGASQMTDTTAQTKALNKTTTRAKSKVQ